jgi:hypothetical protein
MSTIPFAHLTSRTFRARDSQGSPRTRGLAQSGTTAPSATGHRQHRHQTASHDCFVRATRRTLGLRRRYLHRPHKPHHHKPHPSPSQCVAYATAPPRSWCGRGCCATTRASRTCRATEARTSFAASAWRRGWPPRSHRASRQCAAPAKGARAGSAQTTSHGWPTPASLRGSARS